MSDTRQLIFQKLYMEELRRRQQHLQAEVNRKFDLCQSLASGLASNSAPTEGASASAPASTSSANAGTEYYWDSLPVSTQVSQMSDWNQSASQLTLVTRPTTSETRSESLRPKKPTSSQSRKLPTSLLSKLTTWWDLQTAALGPRTSKPRAPRATTLEKIGPAELKRLFISGHWRNCGLGKRCPAWWWTLLPVEARNEALSFIGSMISAVHRQNNKMQSETWPESAMKLSATDVKIGGPLT